ncbi:MAG: SusC/RagA family TonB-linked outer membrane protein [Prolixibacteraceae bacterium]
MNWKITCLRKCLLSLFALFIGIGVLTAQEVRITGTVTSAEDGSPLPGVSVVQQGTTTGTTTDVDGKYTIAAPKGSVLVFSFIGMQKQELTIVGQTTYDVILKPETTGINEVVVTALGIKRDKKALGYSISSIKSDELVESGIPVNPLASLYGKAAGVRISSTANGPTGGMIINIRNSVSLTSSSSTRPLFVVDGIPIFDENTEMNRNDRDGRDRGTGINDINAEDVASIEILKGAKASVLYGHAGANGVVLITTKSGTKRKGLGIDFTTSATFDNVAFLPKLQNEYGSGNTLAVENLSADLTDANGFKYRMVNGTKTPVFWGQNGAAGWGPRMNGQEILWWDGVKRPYVPQPDNYSDLFRTGHLITNSIALSNAGEIGDFRISYTNKNFTSTILEADQQSHSFSFNGNLNIGKFVKLNYISNYYYTFNHNAPFRMQDELVTYGVHRDMDPALWKSHITDEYGYWYFRNDETSKNAGPEAGQIGLNYFWNQTQNDFDESRHHFLQSANLSIKFTDWLSASFKAGFDMTRRMNEVKKKVTEPLADNNAQGYYSVEERNILKLYNQAYLNIEKDLSEDFHLSGMVGGVYEYFHDRTVKALTYNFLVENWFSLLNSRNDVKSEGSGYRQTSYLYGLLGSAQLSFRDQVYLEIQGRNDWSSILPPSNNRYFYPGASLSWIFSETLTLPEFIEYAKTRFSFADVGRPGPIYFGNFAFDLNSYGGIPYETASGDLPPVDFEQAIASGTLPKENLKPERKREFEWGLEMYFFPQNRLGVDISYFHSNTYDQIMALDVPRSSGVNRIITNAGNVQTTGFELQLTGKPIVTRNLNWDVTLNLSSYNTKVKELARGVNVIPLWGVTGASSLARIGEEHGTYYINPWLRDDNGNIVVDQGTGVYSFDNENEVRVGKMLPDVIGGFHTGLNYKGFYLTADFDFQFGGTLISQTNMYLKGNGAGLESLKYRDEARGGLPYYIANNGTLKPLDSHSAAAPEDSKYSWIFHDGVILPGVTPDGQTNEKLISAQQYYERTYWQGQMDITEDAIYKSDYIALRTITVGYEFPKKLVEKTFLSRAKLSFFGNNIAYIYKDVPNVTPESFAGTNEFTEYSGIPGVRSLGFELKLGF